MALSLAAAVLPLVGCGSSQEDLLMRAARRSRPTSGSDEPEKVVKKADQPDATAKAATSANVEEQNPQPSEPLADAVDSDATTSAPSDAVAIKPISERVPEEPLSNQERRARSAENLGRIAEAMLAYVADKGRYPSSHFTSDSGFDTLSWRVEILPYLGYQELYDRFDWNVPWNREPNKSLLQFIPDEFVSPERFDTRTNYLVPANRKFLFGEGRSRRPKDVEDGVDNTIMLLEVNDRLAQPWTKPGDYDPGDDLNNVMAEIGGLREDGVFAAWANGWAVLLGNDLPNQQIIDALSFEAGDGLRAGNIHRNITVGDAQSATVVSATSASGSANQSQAQDGSAGAQTAATSARPVATGDRVAVPIAAKLADAKETLRKVYLARIQDADEPQDKGRLARTMLTDADRMSSDPAGMYTLQAAAMRLAVEAGDVKILLTAIDQRVSRFDVDPYEENVVQLISFSSTPQPADKIDHNSLLKRSATVIYAGIADDDYARATQIARLAYRFSGQDRDEPIPKLVSRLGILLGIAEKEYTAAVEELRKYREDPSNLDAASTVGMFLCFTKGDWRTGLPLLAEAGPTVLRNVATLDLAGAGNNQQRITLGDAWWEISEMARKGPYQQAARDRAVHWYEQGYETLPDSLERLHVKSRIDEAHELDRTSPIALCEQLAQELGVDLSVDLLTIANSGGRNGRSSRGGRSDYD